MVKLTCIHVCVGVSCWFIIAVCLAVFFLFFSPPPPSMSWSLTTMTRLARAGKRSSAFCPRALLSSRPLLWLYFCVFAYISTAASYIERGSTVFIAFPFLRRNAPYAFEKNCIGIMVALTAFGTLFFQNAFFLSQNALVKKAG